ncbi:MAG: LytTR family DNA-binding domain-containing protein [Pseudomonadota bacterium]
MNAPGFTVLLADDDPSQLGYLASMIRRLRPGWTIVAEESSASQVARSLARLAPSLAILDIRFPDATAIDIVKDLRESCPVIFVTGDALFAAEAFTCDAIDFVLKPVREDRLEKALRKAEAFVHSHTAGSATHPGTAMNSVFMINGNSLVRAALKDVLFFEAQRKYTRVVLRDQEGLLKMGISSVMRYLDARHFWRIHRGVVLNSAHMAAAGRDELGRLVVRLRDRPERLMVSGPHEHLFKDGFC